MVTKPTLHLAKEIKIECGPIISTHSGLLMYEDLRVNVRLFVLRRFLLQLENPSSLKSQTPTRPHNQQNSSLLVQRGCRLIYTRCSQFKKLRTTQANSGCISQCKIKLLQEKRTYRVSLLLNNQHLKHRRRSCSNTRQRKGINELSMSILQIFDAR